MNYKEIVNPRIFEIPDYDQSHVTKCWQDETIRRQMSNESNLAPIQAVQDAICEAGKHANYYAEDPTYALTLRSKLGGLLPAQKPKISPWAMVRLRCWIFYSRFYYPNPGSDEAILMQPDYSAYVPRLTFFNWKIKFASLAGRAG